MNSLILENIQYHQELYDGDSDDINIIHILNSSFSSAFSSDSHFTTKQKPKPKSKAKPKPKTKQEATGKAIKSDFRIDLAFLNSSFSIENEKLNKEISNYKLNKSFSIESEKVDLSLFVSSKRSYCFRLILYYMKRYKKYKNIYSLQYNLVYAIQKRQGSIYLQSVISKLPHDCILYLFNIVSKLYIIYNILNIISYMYMYFN